MIGVIKGDTRSLDYQIHEQRETREFELHVFKHKKHNQLYALRRNKALVLVRVSDLNRKSLWNFKANPGQAWPMVLDQNWRRDAGIPMQEAKVVFDPEIIYSGLV